MGKVNALILYPDMTFEEKKVKTDATNVVIDKHYSPSFSMGRSVFKEVDIPRLKFWRKPRNIIILVDGSDRAMELHDSATGEVEIGHWTRKEKEKFWVEVKLNHQLLVMRGLHTPYLNPNELFYDT